MSQMAAIFAVVLGDPQPPESRLVVLDPYLHMQEDIDNSGQLDRMEFAEMALCSMYIFEQLANLSNLFEHGANWPDSTTTA